MGELELLGAFELRSADRDFGGISGARFDGPHLLLLSDRSRLFELDWPDPPPTVARTLPILSEEPLADPAGRHLDAEALALAPGGGRLVGDESGSKIDSFLAGQAGRGEPRWQLPTVFASGAARNQGIEALATLPDGALLAVGEGATNDEGRHPAALRSRSGTVRMGEFASDGGLDPTDAVAIGPCLLILERKLSLLTGWHSRIVAVPIAGIGDGTPLVPTGRVLAAVSGSKLGENYEALAATPDGTGAVRLVVVSDDNFSPLQRTLLLDLRWRP